MSIDGEEKPWMCGAGAVNLRRVGSIVRDIGEPCLQHSPTKGKKMLKPGRWHATFDSDGKIIGFNKILKLIILGGVDPSIRAEVWEFLLGCYSTGSTAEYRWQLRMARRERYNDLLKKCQMMHSSVGTGRLAYAVGSKIMDVRKMSCDRHQDVHTVNSDASQDASSEIKRPYEVNNDDMDVTYAYKTSYLGGSADTACVKERTDYAGYDSPNENYSYRTGEMFKSEYSADSYFDFPPLPVTDLFEKSERDEKLCEIEETTFVTQPRWMMNNEDAHNVQMDNNIDLIREDKRFTNLDSRLSSYEDSNFDAHQMVQAKNLECHRISCDKIGIPYDGEMTITDSHGSCDAISDEGRVADWLWTLHRIVRTDSHLEFYGDTKNIARMSDILAVYAWVDPATGYCQGMSDLLSPFVILYEDNADAFWCFEMLLRRMRQNFHMEGPTGVMKQLEALGRILELTDFEMFTHLSVIGAESLLFAFRMLLVLFRRELSFNEALSMWEMMWAADFDEAASHELADNCLDPLILRLPQDAATCTTDGNNKQHSKNSPTAHSNAEEPVCGVDAMRPISMIPFCGFKPSNFWTRNHHWQTNTLAFSPLRNGDDDLAVFCVAAILILNRPKIIKQACSMDDVIKMFNDKKLEINVKRCVRLGMRLRKKYFYKLMKQSSNGNTEV
ncbi:TBC1 domain family member 15 [Nymphaea thermarum]|nr:TBC1 domain family member 15 [Nymphaea thermarum]